MARRFLLLALVVLGALPTTGYTEELPQVGAPSTSTSAPQKGVQEKSQNLIKDRLSSQLQFVLSSFYYTQTPLNLFDFLYHRSGNQRAGGRGSKAKVAEAPHEQTIKLETSREALGAFEKKGNEPSRLNRDSLDLVILQMVSEQPAKIRARVEGFGMPVIPPRASREAGKKIFLTYCEKCHGEDGRGPSARFNNEGRGIGPYGQRQPFLFLKVLPLNRLYAGGITPQFAERSSFGVHATLPDMSSAATLSHDAWADLQAFVASFDEPQPSDYTVK